MKILVCGSRHWEDASMIRAQLSLATVRQPSEVEVVHGAAPGADTIAGRAAEDVFGFKVYSHPADWAEHGRAAGPIRNRQMLDAHEIDLVLAFTDDPPGMGGSGTWDMITKALAKGIPVRIFSHRKEPTP